jgi:hypothetical protein
MKIGSIFNGRRVAFFILGLIISSVSFWVGFHWPNFGEWLLGGFNYATQPRWFRLAGELVSYLPWIVAAVIVVLRVSWGRAIKPVSYVSGVLISYVAVLSVLLSLPVIDDYPHRRSFDSQAWKASLAQSPPSDPIRLRMVNDLLQQHPLTGVSRSEVLELLGTPPATNYFSNWDLVYWLGPERGLLSIDSEWLVIRFDKTGKVAKFDVVRD